MKIYRVTLSVPAHGCYYVLTEGFDAAVQAVQTEQNNSYVSMAGVTVEDLGAPLQWTAPVPEPVLPVPQEPAVSIKKSVTPDFLICLEDGLKFKSLRRHLTTLGLTPAQYRAKWNLPDNYPMVAANYSAKRAELAKSNGLGRK